MLVLAVGCGKLPEREVHGGQHKPPAAESDGGDALAALARPEAARLIVVERGDHGGRLVRVNERGERLSVVTEAGELILDHSPAWSPDGRWVVFASSRERGRIDEWSLWIAAVGDEPAEPQRLTTGAGIDLAASWSPDGAALVFASTAGGDGIDLWRLQLVAQGNAPPRAGDLERLTAGGPDELDPAWSPDGKSIAYTAVAGGASVIMIMRTDGTGVRPLSEGPADASPDWSPDGRRVVFVAPAPGRMDMDLHVIDADGRGRRHLCDDPVGDEKAPRFDADGRFVLATSVVRDQDGRALHSALVVADTSHKAPLLLALEDKFAVARMGVDPAPVRLDAAVLADAPRLIDAIERTFERAREGRED